MLNHVTYRLRSSRFLTFSKRRSNNRAKKPRVSKKLGRSGEELAVSFSSCKPFASKFLEVSFWKRRDVT